MTTRLLTRPACLCIALACACSAPPSVATPYGLWSLVARRSDAYSLRLYGPAQLVLTSDSAPLRAFGQAQFRQQIVPGTEKRVRVDAELMPQHVRASARFFLRADRDGSPIAVEYAGIPVRGSSGWQPSEIDLVVPDSATAISFGVTLQGSGTVSLRRAELAVTDIPPADAPLAPDAQREIDSALALARTYAIRRDSIPWPNVETTVRRAAAGARSVAEVYPALRLLARSLGDWHSSFYTPRDIEQFHSGANTPVVDIHLEGKDIGYVYLSGYLAENIDSGRAYVDRMHAGIDRLMRAARCGWIIDLRGNTGGASPPMFAAIEPFVARDSLRPLERTAVIAWLGERSPMVRPALEQARVALLLARQTGSAGERVTMLLQRRVHTRSFGSATAGATSRRTWSELPDGAVIAIATAPMDTARGVTTIAPDERVVGDGTAGDPVLRAAVRWLRADGCAGEIAGASR